MKFGYALGIGLAVSCSLFGNNNAANINNPNGLDIGADGSWNTFTSSYIDMGERAADYKDAFDSLVQANPDADIYVVVRGRSIDNIHDLSVTSNNSLLVITYGTTQPYHTEVVKAEDVEQIGVRNSNAAGAVRVYFPQSTDAVPHTHREIHSVDDMSVDGPSEDPGLESPGKP